MADTQYDIPKRLQRLFQEKQLIREANRNHFMKIMHDPKEHATPVYDHAITRYQALWAYKAELMQKNTHNLIGFCGMILLPIGLTFWAMMHFHNKREHLLRTGQVSYEDRPLKTFL